MLGRFCINKHFNINPVKLGGANVVCQVDESLFCHKQKYHRGRVSNHQIWVFGIVDTSFVPARGFMTVVPNRSAATLNPLFNMWCTPELRIIHSDEWRSYNNLEVLGV